MKGQLTRESHLKPPINTDGTRNDSPLRFKVPTPAQKRKVSCHARFGSWGERVLLPVLILCFWLNLSLIYAATPIGDGMARIVSVQGEVFLQPAGTADWIQITTEQDIKVGWGLRTGQNSRARVLLRDQSVITVGPSTSMQFGQKQKRFLTRVLQGFHE